MSNTIDRVLSASTDADFDALLTAETVDITRRYRVTHVSTPILRHARTRALLRVADAERLRGIDTDTAERLRTGITGAHRRAETAPCLLV